VVHDARYQVLLSSIQVSVRSKPEAMEEARRLYAGNGALTLCETAHDAVSGAKPSYCSMRSASIA